MAELRDSFRFAFGAIEISEILRGVVRFVAVFSLIGVGGLLDEVNLDFRKRIVLS